MQTEIAQLIRDEVEIFYSRYKDLKDSTCSINLSDEKWSLKEIVGHLIDSASNNHQRIVRYQIDEELDFPDYKKDPWLAVGRYNTMDFPMLMDLFKNYNYLIAKLIEGVHDKDLEKRWMIQWDPNKPYVTLGELIPHYLDHLRIHFGHFQERLDEVLG